MTVNTANATIIVHTNITFQNLISQMTEAQVRELLHKVIINQPGMVLDVLATIDPQPETDDPEEPGDPADMSPRWCSCDHCRPMPTEEENVCCGHKPEHCLSRMPVRTRIYYLLKLFGKKSPKIFVCSLNKCEKSDLFKTHLQNILIIQLQTLLIFQQPTIE